jgi:hypothetical protein
VTEREGELADATDIWHTAATSAKLINPNKNLFIINIIKLMLY